MRIGVASNNFSTIIVAPKKNDVESISYVHELIYWTLVHSPELLDLWDRDEVGVTIRNLNVHLQSIHPFSEAILTVIQLHFFFWWSKHKFSIAVKYFQFESVVFRFFFYKF